MEYQEILYNTLDGVATITINRPDTLNALTSLTQAEIKHALFISQAGVRRFLHDDHQI